MPLLNPHGTATRQDLVNLVDAMDHLLSCYYPNSVIKYTERDIQEVKQRLIERLNGK